MLYLLLLIVIVHMAKITRQCSSTTRKQLSEQDARSVFQIAQRRSFSCSSESEDSSAGESYSSFWESSDDDTSLSGYSSKSDSELVSDLSSSEHDCNEVFALPMKRKRDDSDSDSEEDGACGRGRGGSRGRARGGSQGRGRGGSRGRGRGGSRGRGRGGSRGRGRGGSRGRGRGGSRGRSRGGSRGRGHGGSQGRGRGGSQGRSRGGSQGRSRGSSQGRVRSRGGGRKQSYVDLLPPNAKSIEEKDSGAIQPPEFQPSRPPGPYVPDQSETSALGLFKLFFDDTALDMVVQSTLSYADHNKQRKKGRYALFSRKPFTRGILMAFLGVLILLGIHSVRNYRKAWSVSRAQVLIRLNDLMTCQRFELIGCFLHVISVEEEAAMGSDPLRKIRPLQDYIKKKCLQLYQPFQYLAVDERIVKSKARCHLVQYMKNKPCKWGFKYWVIADSSGYTVDFDLYAGKATQISKDGQAYDVVCHLTAPFTHQGYQLFVDNFYTGVNLFEELLKVGIVATGTLRVYRKGIPDSVVQLKAVLDGSAVPRGVGYYIREPNSAIVYVCWRDKRAVLAMSTGHPGHSETVVTRRIKSKSGSSCRQEIPCPAVIVKYNQYMGGVDLSDQFLSYHNVLRRTVRFWKTLFYHLVDVAVVNSFILYNLLAVQAGQRPISENDFRDKLVLQILHTYGREKQENEKRPGRPPRTEYRVKHGSKLFPVQSKARCQFCRMNGQTNWTQRKCPDCQFLPALCQTSERDCHSSWHEPSFDELRTLWMARKMDKHQSGSRPSPSEPRVLRSHDK